MRCGCECGEMRCGEVRWGGGGRKEFRKGGEYIYIFVGVLKKLREYFLDGMGRKNEGEGRGGRRKV